jgi:hypothetical protein
MSELFAGHTQEVVKYYLPCQWFMCLGLKVTPSGFQTWPWAVSFQPLQQDGL